MRNTAGLRNKYKELTELAPYGSTSKTTVPSQGFDDFSTQGIKTIHKALFEDVYDWAGEFRTINIQKARAFISWNKPLVC